MYVQMSATRVRTVKQILWAYKRTHDIIFLTATFCKVNKDWIGLIATIHCYFPSGSYWLVYTHILAHTSGSRIWLLFSAHDCQFSNNYSGAQKNFFRMWLSPGRISIKSSREHNKHGTCWYLTARRGELIDCLGVYRNPSLSCLQKAEAPAPPGQRRTSRKLRWLVIWRVLCLFALVSVHL